MRVATAPLSVVLPVPPSANRLTRSASGRKGRASTGTYKQWREEAKWHAHRAWQEVGCPTFAPPLSLHIRLGIGRNRDAGNCNKAIEDLLCASIPGLPDDRWNDRILIERDRSVGTGLAIVTVSSLADTS